jgi:hypothetical protein
LRYPLRKNPKPSLKALEAREIAKLTQRKNANKPKPSALKKDAVRPKGQTRQQPSNEIEQESISAPSAPPLYPTLPPFLSPIPPVYQPHDSNVQNFHEGIAADQTLDRSSFETRAFTNQAIDILQGVAPRSGPFVDTPTNYKHSIVSNQQWNAFGPMVRRLPLNQHVIWTTIKTPWKRSSMQLKICTFVDRGVLYIVI